MRNGKVEDEEGGKVKQQWKKIRLSNGILHVICIFHWQMIWLGCKFDNFKWQWQLRPPHSPTQFSVFNFSCCCNLCIQVAARLMLMMMTNTMMRQLVALVSSILYLFYLQDAFCSCADCQVLPSCSYQEQRTQSASLCLTNYKHNANYIFFLETKLFINFVRFKRSRFETTK